MQISNSKTRHVRDRSEVYTKCNKNAEETMVCSSGEASELDLRDEEDFSRQNGRYPIWNSATLKKKKKKEYSKPM